MKKISLKNINQLDTGFTLLTISQNKANYFLNLFAKHPLTKHPTNYEFPEVMQLHSWLNKLYKSIDSRQAIISKQKKLLMLMKILKDYGIDEETLVDVSRKFSKTILDIINYDININELDDFVKNIYIEYKNQLDINLLIDNSFLLDILSKQKVINNAYKNIIFDLPLANKITPKLYSIIKLLEVNHNLYCLDIPINSNNNITIIPSNDRNIAFHKLQDNSAIFVPNLDSKVSSIKRLINNMDISNKQDIHICSNTSLSNYRSISAIFDLLDLNKDIINIDDIKKVTASPYLFNTDDREDIKDFIYYLQKDSEVLIYNKNWVKILSKSSSNGTNKLLIILNQLSALSKCTTLRDYAKELIHLIKLLKWPNESNDEISAIIKFIDLLKDIESESEYYSNTNIVISKLFKKLIEDYFVLDDNPNAVIQILDYQEAITREFKTVKCIDFESVSQTESLKSDNYLSESLNIKYKINNFTDNKEEYLDSIISSNGMTEIYYANKELPTLLTKYKEYSKSSSELPFYTKINIENDISEVCNTEYLELIDKEREIGTYQLKEFQKCNYRSFAKFRLRLDELEQPCLGLSAKDKGIIIHDVLQKYYTSGCVIEEQLESIVKKALNKKPLSGNNSYINAITLSITSAINDFLKIEKEREPFKVIATEKSHKLSIKDITIKCIIDRIDMLNDGKIVLIDYKTGQATHSHWFGDIKDPQMPIYSLNYRGKLAGLVFGKINHIKSCFSGITTEEHYIDGTVTKYKNYYDSWDDIEKYWLGSLTEIVIRYSEGSIKLSPENPGVCKNCEYQRLCRIWDK
jgi:hypothetical protein